MKTGVLKKWWVGGGLCVVLAACGPQTPGHEAEGLEGDALEESPRADPAQGTQLEEPGATQWTQVGPLVNARALHTATLLYDARVLVVGGFNTVVEVFDPITSRFSAAAPTTTTRRYHTATLLVDGRVLVTGGSSSHGQTTEVYHPATGQWSTSGDMAESRRYHAAALLTDGRVLVAGGVNASGGVLASAEVYDPATGTFSPIRAMAEHRREHQMVTLADGKVLVVGGVNASGQWLASAEVYDPASGTWASAGQLAWARRYHTATLLVDGRVLVVGGAGGSGQSRMAEVYDPVSRTWSLTGAMLTPRSYHAAVRLVNGTVVVSGGYDARTGSVALAEVYDPGSGTFREAPTMVADRYKHTLTLLADGRVLAVGGYGSNGNQGFGEAYDPRLPQVLQFLRAQPPSWEQVEPGCHVFGRTVEWVYRSRGDQVLVLSRDPHGKEQPYFDELAVVRVSHASGFPTSVANLYRWEFNCAEQGAPVHFLYSSYENSNSQSAFDLSPLFGGGTGWFKVELEVRNFYMPYAWQNTYLIRQP
jgi:hypothetical protein